MLGRPGSEKISIQQSGAACSSGLACAGHHFVSRFVAQMISACVQQLRQGGLSGRRLTTASQLCHAHFHVAHGLLLSVCPQVRDGMPMQPPQPVTLPRNLSAPAEIPSTAQNPCSWELRWPLLLRALTSYPLHVHSIVHRTSMGAKPSVRASLTCLRLAVCGTCGRAETTGPDFRAPRPSASHSIPCIYRRFQKYFAEDLQQLWLNEGCPFDGVSIVWRIAGALALLRSPPELWTAPTTLQDVLALQRSTSAQDAWAAQSERRATSTASVRADSAASRQEPITTKDIAVLSDLEGLTSSARKDLVAWLRGRADLGARMRELNAFITDLNAAYDSALKTGQTVQSLPTARPSSQAPAAVVSAIQHVVSAQSNAYVLVGALITWLQHVGCITTFNLLPMWYTALSPREDVRVVVSIRSALRAMPTAHRRTLRSLAELLTASSEPAAMAAHGCSLTDMAARIGPLLLPPPVASSAGEAPGSSAAAVPLRRESSEAGAEAGDQHLDPAVAVHMQSRRLQNASGQQASRLLTPAASSRLAAKMVRVLVQHFESIFQHSNEDDILELVAAQHALHDRLAVAESQVATLEEELEDAESRAALQGAVVLQRNILRRILVAWRDATRVHSADSRVIARLDAMELRCEQLHAEVEAKNEQIAHLQAALQEAQAQQSAARATDIAAPTQAPRPGQPAEHSVDATPNPLRTPVDVLTVRHLQQRIQQRYDAGGLADTPEGTPPLAEPARAPAPQAAPPGNATLHERKQDSQASSLARGSSLELPGPPPSPRQLPPDDQKGSVLHTAPAVVMSEGKYDNA